MPSSHLAPRALEELVQLRSVKDPRRRYGLARPPNAVTLLDIKAAVDGTADLDRCAAGLGRCSDDSPCPQHDTFKPLRQAIRRYLETTTLADIARALANSRALLASELGDAALVGGGWRRRTARRHTRAGRGISWRQRRGRRCAASTR